MIQHCHNRHELSPGISNPSSPESARFCDVCLRNVPDHDGHKGVMSCTPCNIDVCDSCISRHSSHDNVDMGLLIRLRRMKCLLDQRMTLYDVYKQHPKFAQELFRNPDAATIYWEAQKFNYTKLYENLLMRDIDSAREEFNIAQGKLGKAENVLEEFRHERERHLGGTGLNMDVEDDSNKRKLFVISTL